MDLMSQCLGDYYAISPISLITQSRQKQGQASPDIVALKGVRLACMQEPSKDDKINDGAMKELTSGVEPIKGRNLFLLQSGNPFETRQAPSLRTIYDLFDLEKSAFVYQSGQSGWIQSSLYRNMLPLWASNEYLPLQMKPTNIKRQLELNNK
jgi:hypothetical protein